MRIDSNPSGPAVSENNRAAASPQAGSSSSTSGGILSGGVGEDQAQLSGDVLVQSLAAQASQSAGVHDDVRQEKVSALRQALQSGDYSPNPQHVAGALVSHLLAARAA